MISLTSVSISSTKDLIDVSNALREAKDMDAFGVKPEATIRYLSEKYPNIIRVQRS